MRRVDQVRSGQVRYPACWCVRVVGMYRRRVVHFELRGLGGLAL
jgi:hypothetical protein